MNAVAFSTFLKRLAAVVHSRTVAKGDSTTFEVLRGGPCSRGNREKGTRRSQSSASRFHSICRIFPPDETSVPVAAKGQRSRSRPPRSPDSLRHVGKRRDYLVHGLGVGLAGYRHRSNDGPLNAGRAQGGQLFAATRRWAMEHECFHHPL